MSRFEQYDDDELARKVAYRLLAGRQEARDMSRKELIELLDDQCTMEWFEDDHDGWEALARNSRFDWLRTKEMVSRELDHGGAHLRAFVRVFHGGAPELMVERIGYGAEDQPYYPEGAIEIDVEGVAVSDLGDLRWEGKTLHFTADPQHEEMPREDMARHWKVEVTEKDLEREDVLEPTPLDSA